MSNIRKPDLNAPRFRYKSKSVLRKDTFNKFKKKYPEYDDLTLEQFKNIIKTFNSKICQGIIDNRNGVELPDGLGYIFIGTCPPAKKKNVDYKKSLEYGVEASHKNWDSDNKLMKIFYSNLNSKLPFKNRQVWAFKAIKEFRSDASNAYKENYNKYIEVASTQKISAMFDRQRKKEYAQNMKPIIPDNYNEFEI